MEAVEALNLASSQEQASFITISGARAIWYPYVNENYNSYWERRLRG